MANDTTKITKDDVVHAADLIMVKLTEEEIEKNTPQLQTVLDNVEVLGEVDTSKTKETHDIAGLKNIWREDEAGESLTQEEALSNAAETEDGYIKVAGKLTADIDA